ncbi:hypothetical protein CF326_g7888, partial [Tilletia indica]
MATTTKIPKWPTHLALTADVIVTDECTEQNKMYAIGAQVYDENCSGHKATINVWSRERPGEGGYIITNTPVAISADAAITMHVTDP